MNSIVADKQGFYALATTGAKGLCCPVMLADLHTHTNASDGKLSPDELLQDAAAAGVGLLAITDHDTVQACKA